MGYRLEISEINYKHCGGKLYGYVPEEKLKNFESYKWLLSHGKIEGDECWSYGFYPQIVLDYVEFKDFMNLYVKDWEQDRGCSYPDREELEDLLNNTKDKLIEWG